ncbi:MAG TPA: winged helix-turn-helix transcriptional regulator [Nitrososphaeraceae archaeon]|nr:winged helix-turn-helix transcriptional regulator [Nitrososphaeraceae archaeon]
MDLRIIGLLARDSRLSYEKIGSTLNLTRNSIKTRIKRMVSRGVIQEFITDINFAVLGYRIYYVFTKFEGKNSASTKDRNRRKMIIEHLNRLGDIIADIEVLGEVSIYRVAVRETNNDDITRKDNDNHAISLLLDTHLIEKAILARNTGSFQIDTHRRWQQPYLTPTDLKVIRCLVLNPQIGLPDIARSASVSSRTSNRILNKLKCEGIVRFSVICNPAAMKGLVIFGLLIYVSDDNDKNVITEKNKVLERLYTEFPEYPFLRSPLLSHDNIVILSVFGNDVFAIDSMFKRVLSFQEVKNAELYVFTRIKYHTDWIVKEIDRKL